MAPYALQQAVDAKEPADTGRRPGNFNIEQDPELGHGQVENTADCDTQTLCADTYDLEKCPTAEESSESSLTSGASTLYAASEHSARDFPQSQRGNALLRVKTETWKKWSSNPRKGIKTTTKFFYQEIDSSWTAAMVVTCFFVAGLIDAVAYTCWGCFVSMQTGNTVLVALRIVSGEANHHPFSYLKNLISILSFFLGCFAFNILHRAPYGITKLKAPLHRWTLFLGFAVQACLWSTAAIMATTGVIANHPTATTDNAVALESWLDLIPIGLLAFESAGQVCMSRVLTLNELPTVAISSLYHDFIAELFLLPKTIRESKSFKDFVVSQKKQARRLFSCLGIFVGALIGGYVYESRGGLKACLWIGMGAKATLGIAFIFWKRKIVTETIVTKQPRQDAPPAVKIKSRVEVQMPPEPIHGPTRVRTNEFLMTRDGP